MAWMYGRWHDNVKMAKRWWQKGKMASWHNGHLQPETSGPVITLDTELTWVHCQLILKWSKVTWLFQIAQLNSKHAQFYKYETIILTLTFTSRRIAKVLFTTVKTLKQCEWLLNAVNLFSRYANKNFFWFFWKIKSKFFLGLLSI